MDERDARLGDLRDRLVEHGVGAEDDLGRDAAATLHANGQLTHYAVDALDQCLVGAPPATGC